MSEFLTSEQKTILEEATVYLLNLSTMSIRVAANIASHGVGAEDLLKKMTGIIDSKEYYRQLKLLAKWGFIKANYETIPTGGGLSFFNVTNEGFSLYIERHEPNIINQVAKLAKVGENGQSIAKELDKHQFIVNYALDKLQDEEMIRHYNYEVWQD